MSLPGRPPRRSAAAIVLMSLVVLWSAALAFGFAWAAATADQRLGSGRRVAFGVLAVFLTLAAGRTAYELWRRVARLDDP